MSQPELPESAEARAKRRTRLVVFVALSVVCLLAATGYAVLAAMRTESSARRASANPPAEISAARSVQGQPHLVFRSMASDASSAAALVPLADPSRPRTATGLTCERVYFAGGHGLCLATEQGILVNSYEASVFDADFRVLATIPLSGLPSRARVSPDGRYAAMTVFVNGDSYNAQGLSTRTTIVDAASGTVLADLEDFSVTRSGAPFKEADFNFWGVTFGHDSNRFYATLASGGKTYLVEGDVAKRAARVLHQNVECPSLSPDNTRVAFKKRINSQEWRLAVLDLKTLTETPLAAETRSIDDQVEWLDDGHLLYGFVEDRGLPEEAANIWVLPVDGSAPPRIFVHGALSPAVVR